MSALDLLSGDARTFLGKVWACRVHLHRADPDALVGLLSLEDADHLLTSAAIRTPSIRLAKDGAVLPEAAYTRGATLAGRPLTGLVDARKALALFEDGATVVFQGLHRYWPPLTRLVAELELELLEPGVSMYLPTGTPHAARAQDAVSLHVTLGINQLTWRGLVERTIKPALAEADDEHLPAGYLDDPAALAGPLAGRLERLADAVRRLDATAAVEAEVRRFLTSRPPRLDGGLHDALAAAGITDRTTLRRRPGHPCVLFDRGDRVEVLLGDRSMTVPAWIRPALDEVRGRAELIPADLPLDPQSNLVLCRRLVREGLLAIV